MLLLEEGTGDDQVWVSNLTSFQHNMMFDRNVEKNAEDKLNAVPCFFGTLMSSTQVLLGLAAPGVRGGGGGQGLCEGGGQS